MFDRFDVCEAAYRFAMDYHRGQWSPEYAIFGRLAKIAYNPGRGMMDRPPEGNVRDILARFIRRQRRSGR
jgi:hypothetical protein